jgi:hypothetical protein
MVVPTFMTVYLYFLYRGLRRIELRSAATGSYIPVSYRRYDKSPCGHAWTSHRDLVGKDGHFGFFWHSTAASHCDPCCYNSYELLKMTGVSYTPQPHERVSDGMLKALAGMK